MNGTPIDNLRYTQQMPPHMMHPQFMDGGIQTGDGFGDEIGRSGGNMDQLAREVNDSLDDLNTPQEPPKQQPSIRPRQLQKQQKEQKDNDGIMGRVPMFLREPIIIVLIYVVLSLDIVKKTLSSYIPQIKPSADGSILFVGIIIYAMILAISYSVAKRLLL